MPPLTPVFAVSPFVVKYYYYLFTLWRPTSVYCSKRNITGLLNRIVKQQKDGRWVRHDTLCSVSCSCIRAVKMLLLMIKKKSGLEVCLSKKDWSAISRGKFLWLMLNLCLYCTFLRCNMSTQVLRSSDQLERYKL